MLYCTLLVLEIFVFFCHFSEQSVRKSKKQVVKIVDDFAKLKSAEGEVAKRELEVTKREQEADADFADKTAELAKEAKRQHEANLQKADELGKREETLVQEIANLGKAKDAVRQREQQVAEAEAARVAGYADERKKLDEELQAKRAAWQTEENQKRDELNQRLTEQATQRHSALEAEIATARTTSDMVNLLARWF